MQPGWSDVRCSGVAPAPRAQTRCFHFADLHVPGGSRSQLGAALVVAIRLRVRDVPSGLPSTGPGGRLRLDNLRLAEADCYLTSSCNLLETSSLR